MLETSLSLIFPRVECKHCFYILLTSDFRGNRFAGGDNFSCVG